MPRLRRSNPVSPGISRRRRGRGFQYIWDLTGEAVGDPQTRDRIADLVIPPAWADVWICPWPNGHIQAVGSDAAGRRQYIYHPDWRRRRDSEKYARAVEFGLALPALRRSVAADLTGEDITERRVVAAAVRLLDIGCFRIGGEVYARDHDTFGIATLRRRHVKVSPDGVTFCYPAKGSITRTLTVSDAAVAAILAPLRARRGGSGQLLSWPGPRGWVDLRSSDINGYLKERAGPCFSAKDFRTWSGTVQAAMDLARVHPPPRSERARRRAVSAVVKEVSEHLGNTPAVCRASYIDPRVIDAFDSGETIAVHGWQGPAGPAERLRLSAERAVISMLSGAEEGAA